MIRRFGDEGDSIGDLTALLHRAYAELHEMGLHYVATDQTDETTARRIGFGECWVAVKAGRFVGTVNFRIPTLTRGCPYLDRPDVASFGQLGVDPEHRGDRIGLRLIDLAEKRARETGAAIIALDTAEPAKHLIAFYMRLGYEVVDKADWKPTNYESVVMAKNVELDR